MRGLLSGVIGAALVFVLVSAPANGQLPEARSTLVQPLATVPLFRDPIHDGAADPVVVWNRARKTWWMLYTNRRADLADNNGVTWVHGTRIGIAESSDGGAHWKYISEADIPLPQPDYTLWAPEIIDTGGTVSHVPHRRPRNLHRLEPPPPHPSPHQQGPAALEASRQRQSRIGPHHRRLHLPPAQRPLASLVQERGRQLQGLLQRLARPGSLDGQGHRHHQPWRRPGRLPVARLLLAHQRSPRRPRRLPFQ